jgi:hypothetical protein
MDWKISLEGDEGVDRLEEARTISDEEREEERCKARDTPEAVPWTVEKGRQQGTQVTQDGNRWSWIGKSWSALENEVTGFYALPWTMYLGTVQQQKTTLCLGSLTEKNNPKNSVFSRLSIYSSLTGVGV